MNLLGSVGLGLSNLFGGFTEEPKPIPQQPAAVAQLQSPVPAQQPPSTTPVASTASTASPETLAAPVPNNNLGAKVISLLGPVANKALQAAHVEGQDLTKASSILNFVSKPVLDQLKGHGKGWEGSMLQSYIQKLVNKLSSIARETENSPELALDAVKSIGYLAQNIENPKAAQIAFDTLLDLYDPASHSLANSEKNQTREAENKARATNLVTDFVNSKPAEAVKAVLERARSYHNELGATALENIVSAALKSPNNKNGQVEIAIMTNLGSFDPNGDLYGNDRVGVLKHQSLTLTAIQKGLAQSGVVDTKLTNYLKELQDGITKKIAELKA